MKLVCQWKCNLWVNCKDKNGETRFFESIEEAKDFLSTFRIISSSPIVYRIAEYMGGRKYKEIEVIKTI